MDYRVADLDLAAFGREEISLAEAASAWYTVELTAASGSKPGSLTVVLT